MFGFFKKIFGNELDLEEGIDKRLFSDEELTFLTELGIIDENN
jgi:hypothetical protein